MRKLLLLVLAALFPVIALAEDDDSVIYRSSNDKVVFDALAHIGYGYHFVKSNSFNPMGGGEFFVNLVKLKVYPVPYFGLEVAADLRLDHFSSKEDGFRLDADKKVQPFGMAREFGDNLQKVRGWMHMNSFSFPALLKVGNDACKFGAGAELLLSYRGTANYRYKLDGEKHRNKEKGMALNTFSYDFIGVIAFDELSVFFKYYPKGSSLLVDGSGVNMDYWTAGFARDF